MILFSLMHVSKGVARELYIPMGAALAIYARENGDGVMFEPERNLR